MKIHEYQAKQLLDEHGIPIPRGNVASDVAEAVRVAEQLSGNAWVVKAQIHAGGRYEGHFSNDPQGAGGVRFAKSIDELRSHAGQMLGHVLVTKQTGPTGREVKRLYVEAAHDVERELYLAMLVDRHTSRVTLIASKQGGVKIESVAQRSPESILKIAIDPNEGLTTTLTGQVTAHLALSAEQVQTASSIMLTMYDMFVGLDASLIEVSPLAITQQGELLALDATLTFDDNALFRHEELQNLHDPDELQRGELQAAQHGFNYIKLDGNIGLFASGAGLAMATLDATKLYGGEPANFLDLPPSAEVERVKRALQLILSDPGVSSVLINVFGGGIMRCDTIADGIIMANRDQPIQVPMVVRLAGTNATFANHRLKDVGAPVTFAKDFAEAVQAAIDAAKQDTVGARKSWWQRGPLARRSG